MDDALRDAHWRGRPDMHPWTMIAEELLARGWSIEDLAIRMATPDYDEHIREIGVNILTLDLYRTVAPHDLRCMIGEKAGRGIAKAFGLSEDVIVNLDKAWREAAAASLAKEPSA